MKYEDNFKIVLNITKENLSEKVHCIFCTGNCTIINISVFLMLFCKFITSSLKMQHVLLILKIL